MAQITGQAGVNLSSDLAAYLSSQNGNVTSEQLSEIINQYLSGGDKVAAQGGNLSTGIYKRFGEFDTVQGKVETVTTGLWTGDTGSLSNFFTSSAQTAASTEYYLNVYSTDPGTDASAEVQYAVAFGNKYGSGSTSLGNDDTSTQASKATYAQYRQILLEQDDELFSFASSSGLSIDSDDIFVINIARARYKESVDPGNLEFILSGSNGSFRYIDDSGKKFSDTVGKAGRVFNIASGSLNLGTEDPATIKQLYSSASAAVGQGYGKFYPDQGLIVLNPSAIMAEVGLSVDSGSNELASLYKGFDYEGKNQYLIHHMLERGGDFQARRVENLSTSHYFVRAQNREFNFSNNPTFVSGSDGTFRESSFEKDPRTYITSIGLYNDANEMLAVAKTSQPIEKSFDKEVLIKVKLDF
jgi:hypothetical protein